MAASPALLFVMLKKLNVSAVAVSMPAENTTTVTNRTRTLVCMLFTGLPPTSSRPNGTRRGADFSLLRPANRDYAAEVANWRERRSSSRTIEARVAVTRPAVLAMETSAAPSRPVRGTSRECAKPKAQHAPDTP